jgi:hypothetical protein
MLWDLAWVVYDVYPTPSEERYKRPNPKAEEQLARWGATITTRLERLYAASPATYVEHGTRILSRLDRFEGWSFKRNLDRNPAFTHLYREHRAAWLAAPQAMRALLESPNPLVQGIALSFLCEDEPAAADRVGENLPLLRAILLDTSARNVKKRALLTLEATARRSPSHAATIMPVLEEALYFRSDHAIGDRIMVSYVRLRNLYPSAPETLTSTQAVGG